MSEEEVITLADRLRERKTAAVMLTAEIRLGGKLCGFAGECANFLSLHDGRVLLKIKGQDDQLLTQSELNKISELVEKNLPIPDVQIESGRPDLGKISTYRSNLLYRAAEEDVFYAAIANGHKLAMLHDKAT